MSIQLQYVMCNSSWDERIIQDICFLFVDYNFALSHLGLEKVWFSLNVFTEEFF